jgi:2-oxoisovalerate dehydrogenase E2 component (dihydrolipoyl transacylase)
MALFPRSSTGWQSNVQIGGGGVMAKFEILMPDVGEGVTEAEIAEWNVKPGDLVREDDVLAAVMTDKATVEIPSPVDGVIISIIGEIGEVIAVGETIVTLKVAAETDAPGQIGEEVSERPVSELHRSDSARRAVTSDRGTGRPRAAPTVRRRAAEAGVNLTEVTGSGPDGRITLADLEIWLDNRTPGGEPQSTALPDAEVENIKVIGLRRKIAEHIQAASRSIAHMTYMEEVDVTDLEKLRAEMNSERNAEDTPRLTILPFIMAAMIIALKENPRLNAHYDENAGLIRQYRQVHLGLAAQTTNGLMVPVIRNAGAFNLSELAAEITRLAEAAETGTIQRQDLTGSTITLSNLGKMGGLMSTPIVNAPEVAIVGMNKISIKQVWRDGEFVARRIMNLSSSFDHRIVDGWDAALFIQKVKTLVEEPASILALC